MLFSNKTVQRTSFPRHPHLFSNFQTKLFSCVFPVQHLKIKYTFFQIKFKMTHRRLANPKYHVSTQLHATNPGPTHRATTNKSSHAFERPSFMPHTAHQPTGDTVATTIRPPLDGTNSSSIFVSIEMNAHITPLLLFL